MGNRFSRGEAEGRHVQPNVVTQARPRGNDETGDTVGGARHLPTFGHSASTSLLQGSTNIRQSRRSSGNLESSSKGAAGKFQKTVIQRRKDSAIICAAIDFGTTYSGYAFSFRNDPQTVLTNYWDGVHIKTPTVVLMTPNKKFHSFGQDARNTYMEKMTTNEHEKWFLFHRFKMSLFVKDEPLQKDMELKDYTGKKMLAIDVFAAAIQYMKEHLLKFLNEERTATGVPKQRVEIKKETDIHWILTVPAIWNDLSKVFMRQAANKAGIPNDMLTLALEPEAASLFCQKELGDQTIHVGCRYIVLDLGGGTADITCHEVNADGTLKELHRPTGGAFGGTSVDNMYISVLNSIFGADVIKQYQKENVLEYWEFLSDFEVKKRKYDGVGRMVMKFPTKVLELFENKIGQAVMDTLKQSPLAGKVEFKLGKIFIEADLAKEIFDGAVTKIREDTESLVADVDNIDFIILVGGFSESPYVQKVMKEHFSNLIKVPNDPPGAVVKGAVIYGHETKAISSRVCKFTYGIARMMKFKDHHPENRRIVVGGTAMCDDLFNKHIEIGQEVDIDKAGEVRAHQYFPSIPDMKQAVLEVYASQQKDPKFITDPGCQLVGLIKVDIDPKGDIWAKILVKLIFGGTELILEITEVKNGLVTQASVDFMG